MTLRSPGLYDAELSADWTIFGVVNGGYLLALLGRALGDALPHPHPFTVSAHYLAPSLPGPAVIGPRPSAPGGACPPAGVPLPAGRGRLPRWRTSASSPPTATWTACPTTSAPPPSRPPSYEHCLGPADAPAPLPGSSEIARLLDLKLDPATVGWALGAPSGKGEMRGWFGLADGRDPDPLSLLLTVDALPPTAFDLGLNGWTPTVELTTHIRCRPAPEPAAGLHHHPQPRRRVPGGGRGGLGQRRPPGRPVPPARTRPPPVAARRAQSSQWRRGALSPASGGCRSRSAASAAAPCAGDLVPGLRVLARRQERGGTSRPCGRRTARREHQRVVRHPAVSGCPSSSSATSRSEPFELRRDRVPHARAPPCCSRATNRTCAGKSRTSAAISSTAPAIRSSLSPVVASVVRMVPCGAAERLFHQRHPQVRGVAGVAVEGGGVTGRPRHLPQAQAAEALLLQQRERRVEEGLTGLLLAGLPDPRGGGGVTHAMQ